jgi:ubiquinone/menaquinone biosynthesis C-methylase UbiE
MPDQTIRFIDGASYEAMMGCWSLLVGERFLDWIAAPRGARWVDVGCGNGAFTELIVQRCAPSAVQAIDPSEAQLANVRRRLDAGDGLFHVSARANAVMGIRS